MSVSFLVVIVNFRLKKSISFIFVQKRLFDTNIGSLGSCKVVIHVKFLLDLEISTCPPFCLVNQSVKLEEGRTLASAMVKWPQGESRPAL